MFEPRHWASGRSSVVGVTALVAATATLGLICAPLFVFVTEPKDVLGACLYVTAVPFLCPTAPLSPTALYDPEQRKDEKNYQNCPKSADRVVAPS